MDEWAGQAPEPADRHPFAELPALGAWRLLGAHEGHELVRFSTDNDGGIVLEGASVGVEDGVPWHIRYLIEVSADSWRVRRAALADHAGTRLDIGTPRFDYRDTLHFGMDGLAVDYPGIGARIRLEA